MVNIFGIYQEQRANIGWVSIRDQANSVLKQLLIGQQTYSPSILTSICNYRTHAFLQFLPAVSVLTTRKTEECYRRVLQEILSVCPTSRQSVTVVMTDYETGLMNAASEAWPNAEIIGCFFPFCSGNFERLLFKCLLFAISIYFTFSPSTLRNSCANLIAPWDIYQLLNRFQSYDK